MLQGAGVSSSNVLLGSLQHLQSSNLQKGHLPIFDFGLDLGFADFSISDEEGSWVVSVWILSHLVFAPIAGIVNDKISRRKVLIVDTILFFAGFLILTLAKSLPCLILAQLLLGCPLVSQLQENLDMNFPPPSLTNLTTSSGPCPEMISLTL